MVKVFSQKGLRAQLKSRDLTHSTLDSELGIDQELHGDRQTGAGRTGPLEQQAYVCGAVRRSACVRRSHLLITASGVCRAARLDPRR